MLRRLNLRVVAYGLLLATILIATTLFVGWKCYGIQPTSPEAVMPIVNSIVSAFVVIFLGLPFLQAAVTRYASRWSFMDIVRFWDFDLRTGRINIIFGTQGTDDPRKGGARLSVFTADCQNDLHTTFNYRLNYGINLNSVNARKSVNEMLQNIKENAVVLGGDISFPALNSFLDHIGAEFVQDCKTEGRPREVHDGPRAASYISRTDDQGFLTTEAALITRIKIEEGPLIVIASGNYGLGTQAAIRYLTEPSSKLPERPTHQLVQYVLQISNIREGKIYDLRDCKISQVCAKSLESNDWNHIVDGFLRQRPAGGAS
ncbi:MAG: hypothetical protein RLO51_29320 [Thalassobaculum sp.]|uniref:hypothetical protein n=1 Tax=Thalassobaculum sp. TaxID=2022740 RepID=UPI0032EC4A4D